MKPWSSESSLGILLQEITYPFEYAWSSSTDFVSSTWNHYIDLSDTAELNSELSSEISTLKAKLLDYEEKIQEISRPRELLGFVQQSGKNT